MLVKGKPFRSIWMEPGEPGKVSIIDQRRLPHEFIVETIDSLDAMALAIKEMHLRGAPLIGAAAAYGMYLAALDNQDSSSLKQASKQLFNTRPTAVNLQWALERIDDLISSYEGDDIVEAIRIEADNIADEDANINYAIGEHGLPLISKLYEQKGDTINILTHCNAGWLATVDWGTATSAIYQAHDQGIPVHVWVDETRPRNQGARLTAWELQEHGVPCTLIVDNTGGHLMQHGMVDLCIVGTDRTLRNGDVCNKIGTYLKALAAKDNNVPFYVALPSSTIDWSMNDARSVPIEVRDEEEITRMSGWDGKGSVEINISPKGVKAANYAFDVTPARLISGLITEKGIAEPSEEGLLALFPEFAGHAR